MGQVPTNRPSPDAAKQLAIELARLLARDLARADLRKQQEERNLKGDEK